MRNHSQLFLPGERTGVFLQDETLSACAAAAGMKVDLGQCRRFLARKTKIVGLVYHLAASGESSGSEEPDRGETALRARFRLVRPALPASQTYSQCEGAKWQLAELAVELLSLARHADHILLCSGEAAATPLVAEVQQEGARVSIISSVRNRPSLVADELSRQADQFIEFGELSEMFVRPR